MDEQAVLEAARQVHRAQMALDDAEELYRHAEKAFSYATRVVNACKSRFSDAVGRATQAATGEAG